MTTTTSRITLGTLTVLAREALDAARELLLERGIQPTAYHLYCWAGDRVESVLIQERRLALIELRDALVHAALTQAGEVD